MIEVIVDQRLLCLGDRLFDGVKLPREIEAWSAVLDHADHTLQVTCGAFEALDDRRMRGMESC